MSWWALAAQALGSALSSSSSRSDSRRTSREDRAFQERLQRMQEANQRAVLEAGRRWDLEDRRYREEAIGGFRGHSTGNYGSPAYTDTNPSRVEVYNIPDPNAKPPKKPKKSLMQAGGP